jgi:hypothetical protein
VTDGPFVETREQIGGYFLIDAADLDEAIGIAADSGSSHRNGRNPAGDGGRRPAEGLDSRGRAHIRLDERPRRWSRFFPRKCRFEQLPFDIRMEEMECLHEAYRSALSCDQGCYKKRVYSVISNGKVRQA